MIDVIENRKLIGQRIAEIRRQKGMSLTDIAEITGLRRSTVWRVETGKFSSTIDVLCKIADALGYTIDVIENSA